MECKTECPEGIGEESYFEGIGDKMDVMMKLKDNLFKKAKKNIDSAQERYKKDYDKKRKLCQVYYSSL